MTTQLAFHETQFNVVNHIGQIWLTAVEIAHALGYKKTDAVTQIYDRNSDEFRSDMTETLNLSASGNYQKTVRIFSLRGAHLIAMFARTPVAKEFRRWVLDILDRESDEPKGTVTTPVKLNGKVLTHYANGVVTRQEIVPDNAYVATIQGFLEIAERAKFMIVDIDRLSEISLKIK